jgi:hypothetical protein
MSDESSRKFLGGFVSVFIFVVAAYEFSELVLAGDLMGFAYVGLVAVGSIFIIAILKNWRNGVYFFFSWLLFEDLARKYLGNNMAVYFAKDILVAMVYLSFFNRRAAKTNCKNCASAFFCGGHAAGVVRDHADL